MYRGSSPRPIIKYITKAPHGVNWIKIGDMPENGNFVANISERITPEGAKKSRKVEIGDIILSNSMSFGKPYIMGVAGYIHDGWFVIREFEKYFDKEYLCQLLVSPFVQNQYKKLAAGGVVLNISSDLVNSVNVPIISIVEQKKIANFLSLIDQRIEKQRQLVESLKKYKRGLLSAIFERKIRFKDDNGNDYPEWNKIPLGSIFVERVEKATGNEELLSVTINEGIKKRNTIDIKDNSSEDKSHYKKVYKDDIAYNTMRMWQGASGVSKYNGMVSPAYTVISPKIDVNIDFWSYYLKYYKIIHLFQKFSQGLTSDTWNLKFPQFAEIKVLVPSKVEQEKLAEILLTFDNNINIYQNYLDKLEQLKKSLLQQMFI